MKQIIFIIFICFSFFGCEKQEKGFNDKLYKVVKSYQHEIPIPEKKEIGRKDSPENIYSYVYEVKFDASKDTIMSITLKPQGVTTASGNYGVYKDDNLYPTIINDKDKSGRRFINEYRKNCLEKFFYKQGNIIDVIYPIYLYQVHNNDLIFIEKLKGNH